VSTTGWGWIHLTEAIERKAIVVSHEWKIVARARDRLGESPMWHPRERAIYWMDWYGTIHRLRLDGGKLDSWAIPGATSLGSLVFATRGRLMLALDSGLTLFDPATGTVEFFADPNENRSGVSYNDGKVDRVGRLWVGTFDLSEAEPRGILYCIDRSGRVTIADSGFIVCNGPAFSPDGRTLYFSDTAGRRIFAYDMGADTPRLTNRRLFAAMGADEGAPDGLTVDAAGDIWCAHYGVGQITRYAPNGRVKEVYRLPCPNVTSCSLGGEGFSTLYVTSGWSPGVRRAEDEPGQGGTLFSIEVEATGLAEPEFDVRAKA
jgi:sugar lactone lactonase YvrE